MQRCPRVETESETCQVFLGQKYFLCGNYFQRDGVRLHRFVWEYFAGEPVPDGCHVHHEDRDRSNNQYENLCLVDAEDHLSYHTWLRYEEMPEEERSLLTFVAQEQARAWHGSEDGHEWHREHFEKCLREIFARREERVCESCGKVYDSIARKDARFCSNNCKSQWRRDEGLDDVEKTCPECGKVFVANMYAKAVHCSRACGGAASSRARLGRKLPRYEKVCKLCGEKYLGTKIQIFCSVACKRLAKKQEMHKGNQP